ncbi:rhodanese-like domain-containing protein [Candidatus Leptofilum sp.]|uniref:rhodanese-like domain-containing protein n=1 Tax=Candidatus Leptofilum sp. TaxID=3241576 RepID=UPI003B5BDE1B
MQDDQPLKPANILNIVATNQGKLPLTKEYPKAKPLTAVQVAKMMAEGAVVVDGRSSATFGAGHIPGSINVQLSSGEFEQRVGWMTPDDAPLILLMDSDEEAQEAIYKMAFIALNTRVVGYLAGGLNAWMEAGNHAETVPQMNVHDLYHKLSVNGLQVLDVRDDEEWDEGHIEKAHFLPYTRMVEQLTSSAMLGTLSLSKDQQVAVTCATGKRSSTAISIMKREGFKHLYNVTGGMEAWEAAGFPMLDGEGNVCNI